MLPVAPHDGNLVMTALSFCAVSCTPWTGVMLPEEKTDAASSAMNTKANMLNRIPKSMNLIRARGIKTFLQHGKVNSLVIIAFGV
jgi:hypothetical protein